MAKTVLPSFADEKASLRVCISAKPALGVQMVEGFYGGRQEAPGRRYSPAGHTSEVTDLRREARDLKEVVAEQTLELRLLKKSMLGDGEELE